MNHNKQFTRKQRGFTLVEIAIVLVIIGLLLGGVLKGQEMIENARIKSVVGDMQGISAAYNSYLDRYHAIPGDETVAILNTGGRNWPGTVGGNGNGVLAIAPNTSLNNGGEQAVLWRSLRASGLLSGDPAGPTTQAGLPKAGTGGLMAVSVGAYGLVGPTVCVTGLTTKQAAAIDIAVDGPGATNATGNLRGLQSTTNPLQPAAGPAAPALTPYDEQVGGTWTMCKTL